MDDDETNLWIPITPSTRQDDHHDADQQDTNPEVQRLLHREEQWVESQYAQEEADPQMPIPTGRVFLMRVLALLCACSLSVGSH